MQIFLKPEEWVIFFTDSERQCLIIFLVLFLLDSMLIFVSFIYVYLNISFELNRIKFRRTHHFCYSCCVWLLEVVSKRAKSGDRMFASYASKPASSSSNSFSISCMLASIASSSCLRLSTFAYFSRDNRISSSLISSLALVTNSLSICSSCFSFSSISFMISW